jgi:hypothetical protein
MVAQILAEHGTATAMTITLASLASSTSGVGRQSTIVSNVDNAQMIHVYVKVTVGTTPTIDTNIFVHLIKSDATHRSDGAGASDAGLTILNSRLLGVIRNNSASSDVVYYGEFLIRNPGPEWGIAISHDTGTNLKSLAGDHAVRYTIENQESQ